MGRGEYGNRCNGTRTQMIMKLCPYCGNELPDDKTIYCIKCDHIIDEDFILRQKIKEELVKMKPAKMKAKSKKNHSAKPASEGRRVRDDYIPRMHYEEKKSYANNILIAIVVILFLYMFFK